MLRGYSFGLTLTSWGALPFAVAKGQRGSETQRKRSLSLPQSAHPLIGAAQRLPSFLPYLMMLSSSSQHHTQ